MWIACWNCGEDIWFETQRMCRHCDSPAHRCADCTHYDPQGPQCQELHIDLNESDATEPTRLSVSFTCADYQISEDALARNRAHEGVPRHSAPADRAAVAPVATVAAADDEIITIRREPPVKRPPRPIIIAHRGGAAEAPENTVVAFTNAIADGANAIEIDVHLTADGQAIVMHDATVERCTNGTGAVAAFTLDEIKLLDAGSWFDESYHGERVPSLDQAIAVAPAPTVLFIHLRAHENKSDRCERAIIEAVAWHDCRKRTVVLHHTRHGLQRLREMDPKLRLCWIPYGGEPGDEYVDDAYYLGCRFLRPAARDIDEAFVCYAHNRGMWVNAHLADEPDEMQRLIALGVDGIVTNRPRRLRELLQTSRQEE